MFPPRNRPLGPREFGGFHSAEEHEDAFYRVQQMPYAQTGYKTGSPPDPVRNPHAHALSHRVKRTRLIPSRKASKKCQRSRT